MRQFTERAKLFFETSDEIVSRKSYAHKESDDKPPRRIAIAIQVVDEPATPSSSEKTRVRRDKAAKKSRAVGWEHPEMSRKTLARTSSPLEARRANATLRRELLLSTAQMLVQPGQSPKRLVSEFGRIARRLAESSRPLDKRAKRTATSEEVAGLAEVLGRWSTDGGGTWLRVVYRPHSRLSARIA